MSGNTTQNKKRILLRILYITLAISLLAVWGQSSLSKADSTVNSDAVVDLFAPVDELKNGTDAEFLEYDRLAALIRKIAHIIEYAILGFQIMCILYLWGKERWKDYVTCLYLGMTIALIDETIQIFASRGPLVSDIWIDLGGIAVGIGVAFVIRLIVGRIYQRKVTSENSKIA